MHVRAGGIAAVTLMALAACAPAPITPAAVSFTPDPVVTREAAVTPPPDPIPSVVWPLTGLDASDATPEQLATPALAVKIPNDGSHSRPQKSLEYADIVFEQYVEAGIPRLMAVFQSNTPEDVGPVRSEREMDPNIVGSFYGALVFSGANPINLRAARNTDQVLIAEDVGSKGFFRTRDRYAPYNLHVNLQTVLEQVPQLEAPPQQFAYAYPAELATAARLGTPATRIDLVLSRYGKPSWDWDVESGRYLRNEFGDPDITVDGNRIGAENVVVLFVRIHMNNGLPVSEMLVSNSPGYVATGGKVIPILWSKADRRSPYVLTTEDGQPIELAAGQTWVELIPNSGIAVGSADFS